MFTSKLIRIKPINGRIEYYLQLDSELVNGKANEIENLSKQVSSTEISALYQKRKTSKLSDKKSFKSQRVKNSDLPTCYKALYISSNDSFSIFFKKDFQNHFYCGPACYLVLPKYPQLLKK